MSFAETYHRVNSSHWVDPSTPPLPKEEHRSLRDSMLECLGEHPHRERYKRALDYANRPDNAERSPSSPLVLTRLNCAVDLQEDTLPGQLVATRNYLTHWNDKKKKKKVMDGRCEVPGGAAADPRAPGQPAPRLRPQRRDG